MGMYIDLDRGDYYNDGIAPRQRRVHLLRWNPSISSFTRKKFEIIFSSYKKNLPIDKENSLDWSVWNWKEVMHRDLFVMMQVGQKVNGIVWGGFLGGYPYQYEREDGTITRSRFFETTVQYMHRIEKTGLMTADRLAKAVPNVDWLHGHSGEMLSVEDAEIGHSLQRIDTTDTTLPGIGHRFRRCQPDTQSRKRTGSDTDSYPVCIFFFYPCTGKHLIQLGHQPFRMGQTDGNIIFRQHMSVLHQPHRTYTRRCIKRQR